MRILLITLLIAQVAAPRRDRQLVLIGRDGTRTVVGTVPGSTFAPRISPDGREVVYDTSEDGIFWIASLSDFASSRHRLTPEGGKRGALWSTDGKRILYIRDYQGAEALFWRPADGSGTEELLANPARAPESWMPGGRVLSFITLIAGGDYDIWTYSFDKKTAEPFVTIPTTPQHSSHFSPDGRWIAYVSAESGRLEVYVRRATAGAPAIQITKNGGGHPLWSPDQKEMFFDNNGSMFAVAINPALPAFVTAEPQPLPISGFIQGPLRRQYDLMPDGKRFLMLFPSP